MLMVRSGLGLAIAFALSAALPCFVAAVPAAASEQDWIIFGSDAAKSSSPSSGQRRGRPRSKTNNDGIYTWADSSDEAPAVKRTRPPAQSYLGRTAIPSSSGKQQWKVTRAEWTPDDEVAYGEFIRLIGESQCKTTHECLTSPEANPKYHATNPPNMQFFADCADLPFVLRAYFAWKNGLPFSFSAALGLHERPAAKGARGVEKARSETPSFQITGRRQILPPGPDAWVALTEISNLISTGHFRTPATYNGRFLPDYYPIRISRETIKPGIVLFDPLGHIAVVYKVTEEGEVHFIDAHPDNALTRGIYGSEVERAGPESGAGFKAWRPQKLVGAQTTASGLSGGEIVLASDKELPNWSDDQFYGVGPGRASDWRNSKFQFNGDDIDYFGYIRLTLARDGFRYDPVREARTRVRAICNELGYRVDAVNAAIKAGIHKLPQPARLPSNIYVTQGYWEAYATPSRDAQLKSMFRALREEFDRYVTLDAAGSKLIDYQGSNLRQDLLQTYEQEANACSITYTKSDGTPHTLGYREVKDRLFRMSFDPHHCIERRWGATDPKELASCTDDATKRAWYDAEERLRNQLVRTIGDRMDFTLEDLRKQARDDSDVGENFPPDIAVESVLTAPPKTELVERH